MMEWIYWSISWILLRWQDLWDLLIPGGGYFLGTNWNWILAIVFLVITVRVILFPIFVKQIRSQRAMQVIQPKMKALQEKHKGDQQTLREEMMKLYQTEKVNPLMGCLPMFLQIPVFLGLFHVLSYLNPLRHGGDYLYGWDKADFVSASHAKLFGAPISMAFKSSGLDVFAVGGNAGVVKLVASVLVVIMMFTTFMTSRQMILKTGWNSDPQQRMIQKLMLYGIPVSLLLSGWAFPIGVIIYWVVQNIVSLGQQHWVLHKYPPPVSATPALVPARTSRTAPPVRTNPVVRFFTVSTDPVPVTARPAAAINGARSSWVSRFAILRRKPATVPAMATSLPPRALAPRPGARPVAGRGGLAGPSRPVAQPPGALADATPAGSSAPKELEPAEGMQAGTQTRPDATGLGQPAAQPRTRAGAQPGSGAEKPDNVEPAAPPPAAKPAASNQPAGGSPGGKGSVGATAGGAKVGGAKSAGGKSGGAKSSGAKASTASRKSPAKRKGGPKR